MAESGTRRQRSPSSRDGWRRWIGITVILAVAATLRVWQIGRGSLWLDEVLSLHSIMGHGLTYRQVPLDVILDDPPRLTDPATAAPWWDVWRHASGTPGGDLLHPPLGYVLLRLWCDAFGYADATVRLWAAVASVAGVLLLYLTVRELGDPVAAVWAAAIMAVAQTQVAYGQDVRHYALLQAFALAAAWAAARVARLGPSFGRCAALTLTATATLLTHYAGVGALAAVALYAAIGLRGRPRRAVVWALAAAALLFAAVWLGPMVRQFRGGQLEAGFFNDDEPGFVARWATRLAQVPFGTLAEPLPDSTGAAAGAAILFVLPAMLARRRPTLLLWALWIPLTVGVIAGVDLLRHSSLLVYARFTMLAGPGVYAALASLAAGPPADDVLAGGTATPARRWWSRAARHVLPASIVAGLLAFVPAVYTDLHRQDNRRLASELAAQSTPGYLTVFYDVRGSGYAHALYMIVSHYDRHMPGPVLILSGPLDPTRDRALLDRLAARERFLFVCNFLSSPESVIPGARPLDARTVPSAGSVFRATLRPPTPSPPDPDQRAGSTSTDARREAQHHPLAFARLHISKQIG